MVALEIQQFEWFDLPKGHANADVHEACNAHPGRPLALVAPARNSISTSEIDGGWNGDITSGRTTFSELSSCWLHKNLQWHLETHQFIDPWCFQEGCTMWKVYKNHILQSNKILSFHPPNGENSFHPPETSTATHTGSPRTSLPPGVSHLWHFHHMIQLRYRSQDSICQSPSPRGDGTGNSTGKPLWMSLLHIDIYTFFVHIIIYIYILFFRYTSKDVYTLNCWYNYFFIEIHKPKDWLLFRDSPHHFGWTSHYIVPFMWAHEIRFWQFLLRSDHWHKGQVFFLMIIRWITSSFSWIPCYPSSLRQPVHSTGRWHPSLGRCTAGFGFLRDDGLVQFSLPGTFKNSSLYRDTHGYTLWI